MFSGSVTVKFEVNAFEIKHALKKDLYYLDSFDKRTYAMDLFLIKQQDAALLKIHSIVDAILII